jgi:cephalosporin hydroxylase
VSQHRKFKEECSADIARMSKDQGMTALSRQWMDAANAHRYSYHFDWCGRPIIQYPQDIVAMQEIIWRIKPDLIIETGIAHGGSLVFSASMQALIEYCDAAASGQVVDPNKPKSLVVGIDIDIRDHNRNALDAHPLRNRMLLLQGSSIAPEIVEQVRELAKGRQRVLVCLDSNHTHDHVLGELAAYAHLTSIGSYCVVFDTVIEDLPEDVFPDRPWRRGQNPKTAIQEFISTNDQFIIDRDIHEKLQITVAPDGFLRRLK